MTTLEGVGHFFLHLAANRGNLSSDRSLTVLLHRLFNFQRCLAGANTGSLVAFNVLTGLHLESGVQSINLFN